MPKNYLYLPLVLGAIAISAQSQAAGVSELESVKLFGDIRLRAEINDGDDRDRSSRWRFRARIGAKYQANENWLGYMRFRTDADDLVGTNQNFNSKDADDNGDFGISKAYIQYMGFGNTTIQMGKMDMNHMESSELLSRDDSPLEGVQGSYNRGPFALNLGYIVLEESKTAGRDSSWTHAQAVYQTEFSDAKVKLGLGLVHVSAVDEMYVRYNGDPSTKAGDVASFNTDIRFGNARLALDYYQSEAATEDTAYVIQGRYKINETWGTRLYYYHSEAYALPLNGLFTQTNTPGPDFATNVEGFRFQIDYKIASKMKMDLRLYDVDSIDESITGPDNRLRAHLNMYLSF